MKSIAPKQRADIGIRLQTKFMIGIILLECMIMTITIMVVERRMHNSILEEFLKRGVTIAKNLAAVNTSLVSTYNYVGMEQNVAKTVSENELVYASIQLFDGETAAYKGVPRFKASLLKSLPATQVSDAGSVSVRYLVLDNDPKQNICEISAPITVLKKHWATVRIGLSLESMNAGIDQTRRTLLILGGIVLIISCLISVLFSTRITRPIATLMKHVEGISKGDYDQEIRVESRDEIGYLARRFGNMQEKLKDHIRIIENSNAELTLTNQRLRYLFDASQAMTSLKNHDRLYDQILEVVLSATDTMAASLLIVEPDDSTRMVASVIKPSVNENDRVKYHRLLEKPPLLDAEPLMFISENASISGLGSPFVKSGISSFPELERISIPLRQSKEIAGFINLIRRQRSIMMLGEIQTLCVLASQTTTSIENIKLFAQLENAYISSIKSLAKSLEFKDKYTHGHGERVANLSREIGRRINLDVHSLQVLYNAALLHDIGKIGIMDNILNKSSRLNRSECQVIQQHPVIGEEILQPIVSLREERRIVRHHHEREDGRGYPDGLMGHQLSVSEKIIIAADAFDAMNSRRSYRDTLPALLIKTELVNNKGQQFDSDVVDVLLEIYEEQLAVRNPHELFEESRLIQLPIAKRT
ncbi:MULTISPECIES: HD domain-containing phosphohydrolase [Desulfococcus]|nr:HD domain-containing phosphohydrolase [Desulfococcus multivorans]MDX9817780.1 HD domain-containing protein [Desulfococcus multivorans]